MANGIVHALTRHPIVDLLDSSRSCRRNWEELREFSHLDFQGRDGCENPSRLVLGNGSGLFREARIIETFKGILGR